MSAVVHARLFLTPEGIAALPDLVANHRRAAAGFTGFISLRRLQPRTGDEVLLELEFASAAQLQQWRASNEHQQIGREYQRYARREPEASFYDVVS